MNLVTDYMGRLNEMDSALNMMSRIVTDTGSHLTLDELVNSIIHEGEPMTARQIAARLGGDARMVASVLKRLIDLRGGLERSESAFLTTTQRLSQPGRERSVFDKSTN